MSAPNNLRALAQKQSRELADVMALLHHAMEEVSELPGEGMDADRFGATCRKLRAISLLSMAHGKVNASLDALFAVPLPD